MTRFEEVIDMMSKFSFPVRLDHIVGETSAPFGTYVFSQPNVGADNSIYIESYSFVLRVFVEKLDAKIKKEIADALNSHELPYSVDAPIYIEDAKLFEIDYNFGFISEA